MIEKNPSVSQRKLSDQLGVALGVINGFIKKMVYEGMIAVKGTNHKHITYFLTPKGFTEKERLTYHFLDQTIIFYADLKGRVNDGLDNLISKGHKNILCYGAGQIMELVFVVLNSTRSGLNILGIVDDDKQKQGKKMFGHIVAAPKLIKIFKPEAVLITSIKHKEEIIGKIAKDENTIQFEMFSI